MMLELFLRLFCAHLLADFFLQNKWMCDNKKKINKAKGWLVHILHGIIHALTAYLLVADWTCWFVPTVLFVSHFIIDVCKSVVSKDGICAFIIDQIVHVAVLIGVCRMGADSVVLSELLCNKFWVLAVSYLLILKPSSIFVNKFCVQLKNFKTNYSEIENMNLSLPQGGMYIGCLERIMIVTFIMAGCMEGIGFLLAAKSVFRFGDLQNKNEVQNTEYVLIGTFLSFAVAIVVGLLAREII